MAPHGSEAERPHQFEGRLNLPYNIARPAMDSVAPMQVPVQRTSAPTECAICGKPQSDRIHEAAEKAAELEEKHWPV